MKRGREEFTLEDENLKLIEICKEHKILCCPTCGMPCSKDEDVDDLSCAACGKDLPCMTWYEQYHDMEPFPGECENCNALFCEACFDQDENMCKDCVKDNKD